LHPAARAGDADDKLIDEPLKPYEDDEDEEEEEVRGNTNTMEMLEAAGPERASNPSDSNDGDRERAAAAAAGVGGAGAGAGAGGGSCIVANRGKGESESVHGRLLGKVLDSATAVSGGLDLGLGAYLGEGGDVGGAAVGGGIGAFSGGVVFKEQGQGGPVAAVAYKVLDLNAMLRANKDKDKLVPKPEALPQVLTCFTRTKVLAYCTKVQILTPEELPQTRHAKSTTDAFEEAAGSDKFRDAVDLAKARVKGETCRFNMVMELPDIDSLRKKLGSKAPLPLTPPSSSSDGSSSSDSSASSREASRRKDRSDL
jgi:hypothetical protein